MAVNKDVKIDHRVFIALEAMSPGEKKALEPVFRDKHGFITNAARQGRVIKIPGQEPLYQRNAGHGFTIAYSIASGGVVVQDVMRKPPRRDAGGKKARPSQKAKSPATLAKTPGVKKG